MLQEIVEIKNKKLKEKLDKAQLFQSEKDKLYK